MIREELDRLLCDAKSNAELKEKLLKTEQSENPIDNFCSLCRSHGYKISAGELFALGLDESDTKLGRISVASPMARRSASELDCEGKMFWDQVHPTTAVHAALSERAATFIEREYEFIPQ